MPCSDGGPSAEWLREEAGTRASWCAIMTVLEQRGDLSAVLDACDWTEAGVTKAEVLGWWAGHKRRDAERRRQEEQERQRQALAAQARGKLSAAERLALGLER